MEIGRNAGLPRRAVIVFAAINMENEELGVALIDMGRSQSPVSSPGQLMKAQNHEMAHREKAAISLRGGLGICPVLQTPVDSDPANPLKGCDETWPSDMLTSDADSWTAH